MNETDTVIYRYHRYHAPGEMEFASADEALRQAAADCESEQAAPEAIVDAGGRVLYTAEQIWDEWKRRYLTTRDGGNP